MIKRPEFVSSEEGLKKLKITIVLNQVEQLKQRGAREMTAAPRFASPAASKAYLFDPSKSKAVLMK